MDPDFKDSKRKIALACQNVKRHYRSFDNNETFDETANMKEPLTLYRIDGIVNMFDNYFCVIYWAGFDMILIVVDVVLEKTLELSSYSLHSNRVQ